MQKFNIIYLIAAFLIIGCNNSAYEKSENIVSEEIVENPLPEVLGTYDGILPCANCPGIEISLEIREGGDYHKTQVYLNDTSEAAQNTFDDFGKWRFSTDSTYLELNYDLHDINLHEFWQIINNDELRLMDENAQPIKSEFNYSLKKK